jgi:DNA-binding transcriptional MerR regulator
MGNVEEIKTEFKGLIEDFKKFVFGEENKPNEKQKFEMNGTLEDGTPVMIDGEKPSVGVAVNVQNSEGEIAPIMDGEYLVKVGEETFTIKCIGGLIAESTVPTEEEKPQNENQEQMANEKIAELETRIAALEGNGGKSESAMEEATKVREITVKMSSEIEALKKENTELKEKAVKVFESVEKFLSTSEESTHKTEIVPTESSIEKFRKEYLNL